MTLEWVIGKAYKTRDRRKAILVGDARITGDKHKCPLVFIIDGKISCFTDKGKYLISKVCCEYDIIDVWIEPKPKVKRARALVRYPDEIPQETYHYYKDITEIDMYWNGAELLEFPLDGKWREFDE